MIGSNQLGLGSVPEAGEPGAGTPGGATLVHQGTGITVDNTDPLNPIVSLTNQNVVATLDSVNTTGIKLSSLASANLTDGCIVWVKSIGAYFTLQHPATLLTVDHITVENASGLAGAQWIRLLVANANWQSRTGATAWYVDPGNSSGVASDENIGSAAAPLLTWAELARRVQGTFYTVATTWNAMSSDPNASTTVIYFDVRGSATITIQGNTFSGTPIYTGAVTTFTAQSTTGPAADDNELVDNSIPVSFTASGVLADGVIGKTTSGTIAYFFGAKDLGTKTLRTSIPGNAAATAIVALTPAQTYSFWTLTVVPALVLPDRGGTANIFQEVGFYTANFNRIINFSGSFVRCWDFTTLSAFSGEQTFNNCGFSAGAAAGAQTFKGNGFALSIFTFGMFRSTGNGQISFTGFNVRGVTFQGCGLQVTNQTATIIEGVLGVYDLTTTPACQAIYWSFLQFFSPVGGFAGKAYVSGKGNTGPMLSVRNWSKMAYTATGGGAPVPCVDASTSGSSVDVAGSLSGVAALPIFNTNGAATDTGIFASQ